FPAIAQRAAYFPIAHNFDAKEVLAHKARVCQPLPDAGRVGLDLDRSVGSICIAHQGIIATAASPAADWYRLRAAGQSRRYQVKSCGYSRISGGSFWQTLNLPLS